jgi:secreted trypsin-like serine protease
MKVKALAFLVSLAAVIAVATPSAQAITWGEPDGNAHPYVGLLVFDVGGAPSHRCSGTLLSSTVVLTAGHCTAGTSGGRVWFDADVGAGRPNNGYPDNDVNNDGVKDGTGIEFAEIHTHPQFDPNAFYLHDLGIVILSQPVNLGAGGLPTIGMLDGLSTQRGLQEQLFTPVGYGRQEVVPNPNEQQADLVRYHGTVRLIDTHGTAGIPAGAAVLFTNNPGRPASGGTCFGDSGGPVFWAGTNTIVAVTSFGINLNCVGIGGGYRIDTADDQAFIGEFV